MSKGGGNSVTTKDVVVQADRAKEEAKYESQSTTVITAEDIERKQGKSVEDVVFNEVGVTRTVDAMGKVGISIRGADPRHTLIMVDGQPVLGDVSKYNGNGDELLRIGAENIDRIEIVRGAATAKYGADAIGGVVNVITKKSGQDPSFRFNAETSYHTSRYSSSNETSALPSTFYLRGDSGQIGKFNISAWASKRSILPVYAKDKEYNTGNGWYERFKPSLRYYGDEKNAGVRGEYAFNDNHKISFNISHDREDVERRNKSADPIPGNELIVGTEPMQIYKRTMKRDTYAFTYNGRVGKTDWQVDMSHGKTREDDTTLLNSGYGSGHDDYNGKNTLASVDWLEHERTNYSIGLNTAVNDEHYLSYGFGYTKEKARGSRLRNAPKTHVETIDPWDYDKSLEVKENNASFSDEPKSNVHNYKLEQNENGFYWDKTSEYYGAEVPPITYDEMNAFRTDTTELTVTMTDPDYGDSWEEAYSPLAIFTDPNGGLAYYGVTWETALKENLANGNITQAQYDNYMDVSEKWTTFRTAIEEEAAKNGTSLHGIDAVLAYYGLNYQGKSIDHTDITYNGTYYMEGFNSRVNQLLIGEAELKKTYAYIADTWQVNDNTILVPSLRLDHSDLFGSKVTGNIGLTYNLNGNAHRRLKANIGTGYAEPGLGELYYNWEMYGGTGDNNLGWYWIGNPNLKPEKSLNFDVSIEGESNNNRTYTKLSVFHNEIKDYMTAYFTGQLIDFNFNGQSYTMTPDRIYSFRNLGKAKITGIEAEVQHKFNDHWSAKLGYTWLHAINDSDADMPHRLLDRPTHKFDVGINYENKNSGFRGAFWGSYYWNMLDSNSGTTTWNKNESGIYSKGETSYNTKSFGIWNLLLEKDLNKDFTVYAGIDNIFNHQDDDRAYQDRTYRFGINVKFDDLGKALFGPKTPKFAKDKDGNPIITNVYGESWFLSRPSDNAAKAGTVDVYGDYRLRSNMFKGENKVAMRETKLTQADTGAAKNYADKSGHGFEQRLRLGVNYQITDDMNLDVVGSTARHDTAYNVAEKRGLHDAYLEKAELNKKDNKWDWTVGRIHEPMGTTGYWFGQEYDGIRAMYTDNKTQVVIGYGDFSQTTGVTDSAYSHKEQTTIYRGPTINELLGLLVDRTDTSTEIKGSLYGNISYDEAAQADYVEKFNHAGENETDPVKKAEAKLAVVKEVLSILDTVEATTTEDANGFNRWRNLLYRGSQAYTNLYAADITVVLTDGSTLNLADGKRTYTDGTTTTLNRGEPLKTFVTSSMASMSNITNVAKYGGVEGLLDSANIKTMMGDILDLVDTKDGYGITGYLDHEGNTISREDAINQMFVSFVGDEAAYNITSSTFGGSAAKYNGVSKLLNSLAKSSYAPVGGAAIPLPGAPITFAETGGYLLKQDQIPAMDRAAFIKIRQQVADNIGLEAWKLNSYGEGAHIRRSDIGIDKDMRIADVIGVGAKIRLGSKSMLSFDYGQNRSAMGKYFHGSNIYGTGDNKYNLLGFSNGSTPDFWVARLDVGIADTDVPGSWNAYFDYKSFDHGAFLGGTGADLPDRYLDGIRSFTAGFGYVPARNFLLEASYTFDAHSTQQRDTLYTPESFSLGDYTRVTLTYKF